MTIGPVDLGFTGQKRPSRPADEPKRTRTPRLDLARYSGVYVLAAFIIGYGLWVPETFLTSTTLQSILGDQAVVGIVTVGVVIALSAGVFDLSFANNISMSGVLCGSLMYFHHFAPWQAIVASLASGVVLAVVNAYFVVKVGLNSIVVTLGTSSVLLALTSWLSDNGQFITGFPASFTRIASPKPLGIPMLTIIFAVVAFLGWYLLEHTPVGRRMQATGLGPDAARLAGVATSRMTLIGFLVAGLTSSLAGVLVTAQVDSAIPTAGAGYLLPVVAGAFLGATQFKPGRLNIAGTVLAIYLLATGVKGLQLGGGGHAWITDAFNGVALLAAVTFAALSQRSTGGLWRRLGFRRENV
ncbi:ABC transporter permease [Amycolatopsis pigmentata]|uniref:ABC transporter permease n=1 Tax=Amycolatopsis pigmentata TaxID=450801 RepID=A0ABW5FSI3_9PSEU